MLTFFRFPSPDCQSEATREDVDGTERGENYGKRRSASITLNYAAGGAQLVRAERHHNVSPPKWVYKARRAPKSLFKLTSRRRERRKNTSRSRQRTHAGAVYIGDQARACLGLFPSIDALLLLLLLLLRQATKSEERPEILQGRLSLLSRYLQIAPSRSPAPEVRLSVGAERHAIGQRSKLRWASS